MKNEKKTDLSKVQPSLTTLLDLGESPQALQMMISAERSEVVLTCSLRLNEL